MLQAAVWLTKAEVRAATTASKVSSEVWSKALVNELPEDPDETNTGQANIVDTEVDANTTEQVPIEESEEEESEAETEVSAYSD